MHRNYFRITTALCHLTAVLHQTIYDDRDRVEIRDKEDLVRFMEDTCRISACLKTMLTLNINGVHI